MAVDESAEVSERAGIKDHADNVVVLILVFTILVSAGQAFGRWLGNTVHKPGLTSFFGG